MWIGGVVDSEGLDHYIRKKLGKNSARARAAWASQTGVGLLFFAERKENAKAKIARIIKLVSGRLAQ